MTVETRTALPFRLGDMTSITGQLATVLAKEVEYLRDMRIAEIEPLQREKNRLLVSLERMKTYLDSHPEVLDLFSEEEDDWEEFRAVAEMFEEVLIANHRHLMVAREVNATVISAVRDALKEDQGSAYYRQVGNEKHASQSPLTMGINDVV